METNSGEPAERLWADDENAKARILSIDLGVFDELVTYPGEVDWPDERRKILFLQTALRVEIPWNIVVQFTAPHFGQTLRSPFLPVVTPLAPPPFTPPAFDIARQTVGQWAEVADEAWRAYRASVASEFRESRDQLIQSRILREFDRPRRTAGVKGQSKSPIVDEKTAYLWAVIYFFGAQFGRPLTWAEIANDEPQSREFKGPSPAHAKLKRKLAEQVRTNVTKVLRALKLPE